MTHGSRPLEVDPFVIDLDVTELVALGLAAMAVRARTAQLLLVYAS